MRKLSRFLPVNRKQAVCERCGVRLTDLDWGFARYGGRLCTDCREKEREKQLRARGYLRGLEDTRLYPDSYVIIDGDNGAICYAMCPASSVKCDETILGLLARDLEEAIFPGDSSGARVSYKRVTRDHRVDSFAVGEDTGIATEKLWLPKWLSEAGFGKKVQQILEGELERLNLTLSEQTTLQLVHKEYQSKKFEEDIK